MVFAAFGLVLAQWHTRCLGDGQRFEQWMELMKCAETTLMERHDETPATESRAETNAGIITLPLGLLGFEKYKSYVLLASPEETPFLWLRMVDNPNLAFLVVAPSVLASDYQPDLSDEDVQFLGLQNPDDALLFNIVTVHKDGKATLNLKGPIVVNRQTLVGKQIIPLNAGRYSLQHPVQVAADVGA
jgi:flagellar assembly factor FliW